MRDRNPNSKEIQMLHIMWVLVERKRVEQKYPYTEDIDGEERWITDEWHDDHDARGFNGEGIDKWKRTRNVVQKWLNAQKENK